MSSPTYARVAQAAAVDWPLLEEAVDKKIEDQAEFVTWWDGDDGVQPNHRPVTVADRRQLSVPDAEQETGITKQQVSRWRKCLADVSKYRQQIILATCRKDEAIPRAGSATF